MIYHYPATGRPPGRDTAEVEALKAACLQNLPVFVVTTGTPARLRNVTRGFVADFDDRCRQCLILFGDSPPLRKNPPDDGTFVLRQPRGRRALASTSLNRSASFQFAVLKRYGARCAVCDIAVAEVIDAAHLCSVDKDGSDDPRNGLPLCATHHRAFDAALFGFKPGDLRIVSTEGGPSLRDLRITRINLAHLRALPHPEAVAWYWAHKRPRTGPILATNAVDDAGGG